MYGESLAEAGHCRMKYKIHFLTPVTEWFCSRDRVRMVPDGDEAGISLQSRMLGRGAIKLIW